MPTGLDIGCGERKRQGMIGLDIKRATGVDIIGDARYLPFKGSCFDYIYSSHVIEHISHCEIEKTLKDWIRTLKDNGVIEIRCPDFRASCFRFFIKPSWQDIRGIFGMQTDDGEYHKRGFSYGILKKMLKDLGIRNVKRVRDWRGIVPWADLYVIARK